jgi:hypothetical protein
MDKLCNWYFSFYTAVTSLYLELMVFGVFLSWKHTPAGYVASLKLWFGLWYTGHMDTWCALSFMLF